MDELNSQDAVLQWVWAKGGPYDDDDDHDDDDDNDDAECSIDLPSVLMICRGVQGLSV